MTRDEFIRLEAIIKNNAGPNSFLANPDTEDRFYNICVPVPFDAAKDAIIDLIENEAYSTDGKRMPLDLYRVRHKIEREVQIRREQSKKPDAKVCPNCQGRGWMMVTYSGIYDTLIPCRCEVGRERYPSLLMDDAARETTGDEGARRSWQSYRRFRAPEDFIRKIKYGE